MSITIQQASTLLQEHGLLREIIVQGSYTLEAQALPNASKPITTLTYDSRTVNAHSMLVCKGNFDPDYLQGLDQRGLLAYVAEHDYSHLTAAVGLIVHDPRKALSVLSSAFYNHPERELTIVGITGTKGKTTTSHYIHAILQAYSGNKAALFTSIYNCLDGVHMQESDLTTPESLDAFAMMRQAVDNGMQYLVMEISSQAYKVDRVFNLHFDVGTFLNISPDHISDIEHASFEDYLYCKRQIIANSTHVVLNANCEYCPLLLQDANHANAPVSLFDFGSINSTGETPTVSAHMIDETHSAASVYDHTQSQSIGTFRLHMPGDFNYENMLAALCIARALGIASDDPALQAVEKVTVEGRMQVYEDSETNTIAIVDYAHNYASVKALLDYVQAQYGKHDGTVENTQSTLASAATQAPNAPEHCPRITLVTGSAGNKAIDRRKEIIDAAQHRVSRIVLTTEDTDTEPNEQIIAQMHSYVTNPSLDVVEMIDRAQAVQYAVNQALQREGLDVLLFIGKGNERWIKMERHHVAYEGDDRIVERLLSKKQQ